MLNRQKTLVQIVRLAGGKIDRLALTKWAFLLRHETPSRGGDSFYDFVPYHYGPFSFALYQEAEKLIGQGYLREGDQSAWELGDVTAPEADATVREDLARIATRFRRTSLDSLLNYVYEQYPSFTVNSKRRRIAERPTATVAVYTAGYEGKSIDGFLNGLIDAGIAHLIDVRRNPVARRYGFHRSTLHRLCSSLGIQYSHVPELGIASELRQHLETPDDYRSLFRRYEDTTLKTEPAAIHRICDWMRESPSVLVCMESQPECCHRARLAKPVSQMTGLPIVHIH